MVLTPPSLAALSVMVALPNGDQWEVRSRELPDLAAAERLARRVRLALSCQRYGPAWWKLPDSLIELRQDLVRAGVRRHSCEVVIAERDTPGPDAPHGWRVVQRIPVTRRQAARSEA